MTTTTVRNPIRAGIEELAPSYFAMVMATGIVSIAANLLQMRWIAFGLFYINIVAYIILWILTLARLIFFPKRMLNDLVTHSTGPGYFTLVAGTCVLGSDFVVLIHNFTAGIALWVLGSLLWIFIMYAFFTAVVTRSEKPTIEQGINGAWLIATVATQSISILGTLIAAQLPDYQQIILFIALIFYLLGCMLYLNIITLIFYRFTFFVLKPETLTPPYWINMGAVAITTLAGSTLMLNSNQWNFLIRSASLPERLHLVFLGNRFMVDSLASYSWFLAAYPKAISIDIQPLILGDGLSSGHVYCEYLSISESHKIRIPPGDPAILHLSGFSRLGAHCVWIDLSSCHCIPQSAGNGVGC